jgi:predicted Zn-dependent protease
VASDAQSSPPGEGSAFQTPSPRLAPLGDLLPQGERAANPPRPGTLAIRHDTPTPAEPADPLTLAAECLGRGDEPAACGHLETHVRRHPEQVMFRAHLADLLFRLGRLDEAKFHFERFVADAQAATGPPRAHLVHCHTRLMEVAQRTGDRPAELFHRGAGLLLLVRQQDADPATRDGGFREEVLCKAIKALAEAKDLRPADPRVRLYLAEAYDRSGNRRGAEAARAAARNLTAPGALTPAEQRRLAEAN